MRTFAILAAILLTALPAVARKKATTRKVGATTATTECLAHPARPDSVAAEGDMLLIYGYDKPLQATKEVFFATNNTARDICEIRLSITYTDTSGRQLHKASLLLPADIPAGQTRKVEFRSWDTQKSFYYTGSRRPRTSAIPYKVTITPEYIYFNGAPD